MILVDTSVWIDHLRNKDVGLETLLDHGMVLCHPLVVGELVMGDMRPRKAMLQTLHRLPLAVVARHNEVLHLVEVHTLFGLGLSYIDVHLLASVKLTEDAELWTRDKRMLQVAEKLEIAMLGSSA